MFSLFLFLFLFIFWEIYTLNVGVCPTHRERNRKIAVLPVTIRMRLFNNQRKVHSYHDSWGKKTPKDSSDSRAGSKGRIEERNQRG